MADYEFLLTRALTALPQSTPEARRAVYERARSALLNQLRNIQQPVTEAVIVAEERALDEAIARIEANVTELPAPAAQEIAQASAVQAGRGSWITDLLARASREVARAPLPAGRPTLREQRSATPQLQRSIARRVELEEGKPMSRLDNLNKILGRLQSDSPGVEASALISEDGLMIASSLTPNMEETRVAGMAATLQNLGTRAAVELARGKVREVIVRGDGGYAVMISTGRGALLLALANESSKLGLIFFDMHEAIKALRNVL